MVVMFCAFAGAPKIVRLHGRGEVVYPRDERYRLLALAFPGHVGVRAIIRMDVERVSDSCGFAVPFYEFVENRDALDAWALRKGNEGLAAYRLEKNSQSIDGIPGYRETGAPQ